MKSKITLVTPPDIYENSNKSLLFVNLSTADQDFVSKWLHDKNLDIDVNFCVFSGEPDIKWLLWACGACQHKYIDLNNSNEITIAISSYVLGKSGFMYKVSDENLAAVYSHINPNRILNIKTFLERAFSE